MFSYDGSSCVSYLGSWVFIFIRTFVRRVSMFALKSNPAHTNSDNGRKNCNSGHVKQLRRHSVECKLRNALESSSLKWFTRKTKVVGLILLLRNFFT
ncbi:hypothetical protein JTE90_000675 [Oedothorax gibbosus]|uniref:Uncharacterized protein n=1 Tax=Oedothorax gibbosus TaxID=931172 RepID=A0AAV6TPQ8_9ARAC|nr:hypothetical protein JTE90_000675 [Oedothorax gibbosus]